MTKCWSRHVCPCLETISLFIMVSPALPHSETTVPILSFYCMWDGYRSFEDNCICWVSCHFSMFSTRGQCIMSHRLCYSRFLAWTIFTKGFDTLLQTTLGRILIKGHVGKEDSSKTSFTGTSWKKNIPLPWLWCVFFVMTVNSYAEKLYKLYQIVMVWRKSSCSQLHLFIGVRLMMTRLQNTKVRT